MLDIMRTLLRPRIAKAPEAAAEQTILGVDPGLQRTGYAFLSGSGPASVVLREAGVVRLNPRASLETRLVELEQALRELIEVHRPDRLVCEQLYAHYKHPRTAILMGHARGVILLVAASRGVEVSSVAATNVKKLITGSGRAGKGQVQRAVAQALRLPTLPEPHDVSDALAMALCGFWIAPAKQIGSGSEQ